MSERDQPTPALWRLNPTPQGAPLLAGLLTLLTLAWLAFTSKQVGVPRDESVYLYAADRVSSWLSWSAERGLSPLSVEGVQQGFGFNHEHPALMKELFALSHHYLHVRWDLISDPTLAYRLPTMLLSALTVGLTTLLTARLVGLWAALAAGLALLAQPRLFFHAHLACFDAPVMFMWLLIIWTYLEAQAKGGRWVIMTGLALGLGLATKLNATFAPFLALGVSVLHVLHEKRASLAHPSSPSSPSSKTLKTQHLTKRYALIGASMITLGLGVFWAHWPWLYHDTWARLMGYIQFHARHEHYPVDFLGTLYYRPPFPISFPFVMLACTVPVSLLCLSAWGGLEALRGAWRRWRGAQGGYPLELLILANLAFALCLIALPSTPIFGGTKHWITSMPFLAILAGVGFERARVTLVGLVSSTTSKSSSLAPSSAPSLALLALLFTHPLLEVHRFGAYGTAWYNALAGGPSGAAAKRLPRDFWGHSSVGVLPTLNERSERGAGVFWHNATGAAVWRYKRDQRLRSDVRSTGDWTYPYASWGVYHAQREKRPEEVDLWWAYGRTLPVSGYFVEGVQLIGLYQRAPDEATTRASVEPTEEER